MEGRASSVKTNPSSFGGVAPFLTRVDAYAQNLLYEFDRSRGSDYSAFFVLPC